MRQWLVVGLVMVMLVSLGQGTARATLEGNVGGNVIVANEYISIIVNGGKENTGRFSINTTGGDPDRIGDENKPLVYGMADPWTSYTTVQIDGQNYVFGGRTQTSAGRQGPFGKLVVGPEVVEGNVIRTVYQLGAIEAEQMLSFTRSSTTGLKDTARIAYRLTNRDTLPHLVGMRLMLDTMLGANDGAPFRVKEQAVTTDTLYTRAQMPDFWQAFDSLADPQVMSQGTLKGMGVTTPDRVYFTNWGVLAESVWDFDFEVDRIFLRKGEFELDSAIAMFWDPITIPPGESVTWVTYYGLGGITIAPGKLSLGVTSPAIVTHSPEGRTRFPVVAYLENSGEGELREVRAGIQLPEGLSLVPGQETVERLGNLAVGESVQIAWQVEVEERVRGEFSYLVRVEAANSEPNQVQRKVQVVNPARLQVDLSAPPRLLIENGSLQPVPFAVRAAITNVGEIEAPWVQAQWQAPLGLQLAPGETPLKLSGDIAPEESRVVQWFLTPTDVASDNLPYSVRVESGATDVQVLNGFISIPQLPQLVRLIVEEPDAVVTPGDPYKVAIKGYNLKNIQEAEFLLQFPVKLLRVAGGQLGVERGQALAAIAAATGERVPMQVEIDRVQGIIRVKITQLSQMGTARLTGNLCAIRFLVMDGGSGVIQLHSARLTTSGGQVIELGTMELPVTIGK
ncbi:MAG: cellulosome anchor protein [Firmicutes bacterium]|nr:cellulosome anchor protein [Bacillota bacterium]